MKSTSLFYIFLCKKQRLPRKYLLQVYSNCCYTEQWSTVPISLTTWQRARSVHDVISSHMSIYPLESFFGKQRQRGSGCDNSTVSAFLSNTSSLRAQGSVSLNPCRGIVQHKRKEFNEREIIEASKPLPKRKKIHQTNE